MLGNQYIDGWETQGGQLVTTTLRNYHVPDKIHGLLNDYFCSYTIEWQRLEVGNVILFAAASTFS